MLTKISAWILGGAATGNNLTGSCILLKIRIGERLYWYMVDCGLWQGGDPIETHLRNLKFPFRFDASKVMGLFLTHSHMDHSGRIPRLIKDGFAGDIFCTKPTAAILPIMLADSARIQMRNFEGFEEDFRQAQRKKYLGNKGKNRNKQKSHYHNKRTSDYVLRPLYSTEEAEESLRYVTNEGYDYGTWINLGDGMDLRFHNSAHILGSASCELRVRRSEKKGTYTRLLFSGDLGRNKKGRLILPSPQSPEEQADFIFTEATYGGKAHTPRDEETDLIKQAITETVAKGGKVIIAAFALERSQEFDYLLSYLMDNGDLARVPIFLDSPMSIKITNCFYRYRDTELIQECFPLDFNSFGDKENHYVKQIVDWGESTALAHAPGPYIVITSAGMCNAGNIVKYLSAGLEDEKNLFILGGYQVEGSSGARLAAGHNVVSIGGQDRIVKAKIMLSKGSSNHAEGKELTDWSASNVKQDNSAAKIIINHAEWEQGRALRASLLEDDRLIGDWNDRIIIPNIGEEIVLM